MKVSQVKILNMNLTGSLIIKKAMMNSIILILNVAFASWVKEKIVLSLSHAFAIWMNEIIKMKVENFTVVRL